ncbi:unnamed protein product [Alopecurus aequalis]
MAASSSSAVLSPPPLVEGDGHDAPNWILLDILGYMCNHPNATIAESSSKCPSTPPARPKSPTSVFTAQILGPPVWFNPRYCDYFLYMARPQKSLPRLLPHPHPNSFRDREVALLSFGKDDEYAVAALTRRYHNTTPNKKEFNLYLYQFSKRQDGWASKVVSVTEPRRDKVCPSDGAPYHDTTKVIILGHGWVGWVDLWRGILACNVLEQNPVLLDNPLPLPLIGNRRLYHKCCPNTVRDITANVFKDTIKYIEIQNPWEKVVSPNHPTDSAVRQMKCRVPSRAWMATTWRRTIPIDPKEDWHEDCTFDVANISIDPMHSERLPRLRSTNNNPSEATLPADLIGFPIMSMDDDIFYLLYMAYHTGQKDVVISIDTRKNTLQGFAKLLTGKDFTFTRACTTEISKYIIKDEGYEFS